MHGIIPRLAAIRGPSARAGDFRLLQHRLDQYAGPRRRWANVLIQAVLEKAEIAGAR